MNQFEQLLVDGNVVGLQQLLAEQPVLANQLVGKKSKRHPIHGVCDWIFERKLSEDVALSMVSVLIESGADVDHRHPKTKDSLLIVACSLAAPQVANGLLDAGADVHSSGLFGATALHWAALLGMPSMTASLIRAGADCALCDTEYHSTPLGWAIQGWKSSPIGSHEGQVECASLLVKAGSPVLLEWLASEEICAEPQLLEALNKRKVRKHP